MKITDEMFKVAIGAYVGHAESALGLRAAIEAVAPLIARAEAEECAGICQRSIEADNALRDSSQVSAEDVMIAVLTAKDIQIAIRARHATTPLASKEKEK